MKKEHGTIFVGREEELRQLMAFAKEAFTGKPSVAFVTGEAGIGKTFLVKEFFKRLREEYENIVIASGQCSIQSASYLPFQTILEDLLESQKTIRVSGEKFKQVTEVVVDTIWNVGPDLIGAFGLPIKVLQTIADKLGLRGKKSAVEFEIPKDLDKIRIFGWYTKVMKDISAQFPLVLFLDDLQWADDSSLNLLLHLGRELENQRMIVIGTYRPHEAAPNSLLMQVNATLGRYGAKKFSLDIAENTPENIERTRQFVHQYLIKKYKTNFSDQFEVVLADRTEGNALFLTEILQNMEEKGQIAKKMDTSSEWQLTQKVQNFEDLPEKIENAISERVNRLEETLREILDYASVEGDNFIAQVIAKVRGIQEGKFIDTLTKRLMKTYHLIWECGGRTLSNAQRIHEFSFKHNLIRKYVYDQLSETNKEFIHAEIGECLEQLYQPNADEIASTLAIHFVYGHVLEKAIYYCLKASQNANKQYGNSEASRFSKMGLTSLAELENSLAQGKYLVNKVQLLLELSKAEGLGGNEQEEKDHIQAGISYLENNLSLMDSVSEELRAEVYAQLAQLYIRKSTKTGQEAKKYLEKALNIYKNCNNIRNVAEIFYKLSLVYQYIPKSEEEKKPSDKSIVYLKSSLSIAKRLQDSRLQTKCLSLLTWKYLRTDLKKAKQCALQALDIVKAAEEPDHYLMGTACYAMMKVCREEGKFKTGIQYLEDAQKLAIRIGRSISEAEVLDALGRDYSRYVNLQEEAQNALKTSIAIKERIGSQKYFPLSNLGWILLRQGRWRETEELLREAIEEASERSSSLSRCIIGRLYMFQENYNQAEKEFFHRFNIFKKYQSSPDLLDYVEIALNYALRENWDQCKRYMGKSQTLFTQEIRARFRWEYLYQLAELNRLLGELELAKNFCQQSIDQYIAHAENPEELISVAEARLVMGKILVDMQNYQEAIPYLEKAIHAFEVCKHYAFGEALLYSGKAHRGLGGTVFLNQAKDSIKQAISEFQRLELHRKKQKAEEVLKTLS